MPYDLKKIDLFPTQPGVYLMKSASDKVLYVGKAKNLRSRVKQYFIPGRDGRLMVPFLVSKVETIDTIVVLSEKEALLLENNLIKKYQPKYNALLKDDKAYIALKISTKEEWPRVELVRYKGVPENDGLYFGPYTSAQAARETLDLIQKLFPLRQCSNQELKRRTRPCILHQMGRCVGPCSKACTKDEYQIHLQRTIKFLKGQDKEILKDLYAEMKDLSDRLEFEKASAVLKSIRYIEKTIEQQRVDKPLGGDADALGIYRHAEDVILTQLQFRQGKLVGSRHFDFTNIAEEDHELLESFLLQHYPSLDTIPHEILIPVNLPAPEAVEDILSSVHDSRIHIHHPQRGDKKALIEMAHRNAEALFKTEKSQEAILAKTLLEMQEHLELSHFPGRIECFDTSNIAGTESVACLVAFTDGHKDSKRYRKYNLHQDEKPDDYAAMFETLTRRYKRAKEENDLPDLIIVDGGKGQLNIALKVLNNLSITEIDVIGLAKEQGRHDKGMSREQIFLPNRKDPILLKTNSPILFFLQRIRDEAHRFAVTFHRKKRSKKMMQSQLDEIEGIGNVKRKALLKHFGGVKKIQEASDEEIREIQGITAKNIEAIRTYFNK